MVFFLTSKEVSRKPHKPHLLLLRLRQALNARCAPAGTSVKERVVRGALVRVSFYPNKPPAVSATPAAASSPSAPRPSVFTGVVTAIQSKTAFPTFTVRAVVDKVGVEQVYPMYSPLLESVSVLRMPLKRPPVNLRKKPSAVDSMYTTAKPAPASQPEKQ